MKRLLVVLAIAGTAAVGHAGVAAASAVATPGQLQAALHGVVSSDDGSNVYDSARNQVVRFMGDVNAWPCAHDAIVVNTPGRTDFTLMHYAYGCGLQAVRNWNNGTVYWFGGALATSSVIYNYGARIRGGKGCDWGCPVGNYVTEFNARTLQLIREIPVLGPAKYLSLSTAVAWPGGHWLVGTYNCGWLCIAGKTIWIPNGDEARPAGWSIYDTLPGSLHLGTVVSLYRSDGQWFAITKQLDAIGARLEELTAKCLSGCTVRLTGRTWPTQGSKTYSAQIDSDPAPAGQLYLTYAENDKAWYGLHWLSIRQR